MSREVGAQMNVGERVCVEQPGGEKVEKGERQTERGRMDEA